MRAKNLHLTISTIVIIPIALAYGLFPAIILPKFFDISINSIDVKQVFRATMGLYLGMLALWVMGILKPHYWRMATFSNVLFMTGLAAGRIISIVIDGIPSAPFIIGLALELALAVWGMINLNKYRFFVIVK